MVGIYKITNKLNGKSYVGQSIHIERRWQEHKQPSANSVIAQAIKKYGEQNFQFEILEEVSDITLLNAKEAYYIQMYNTIVPNGYNVLEESDTILTTFSTFDKDIFYKIVDKIKNTNLTFEQIAKEFNLNRRTINRINQGYTHKMPDLEYPLRETKSPKPQTKCIDCGAIITSGCKRCVTCAQKASRQVNRPDRETLKKLIRENPFVKIGEQFKVSDNTIRKWCEAYNLPKKKTDIKKYTNEEWELI